MPTLTAGVLQRLARTTVAFTRTVIGLRNWGQPKYRTNDCDCPLLCLLYQNMTTFALLLLLQFNGFFLTHERPLQDGAIETLIWVLSVNEATVAGFADYVELLIRLEMMMDISNENTNRCTFAKTKPQSIQPGRPDVSVGDRHDPIALRNNR
jgi:hypothetical protein